MRRDFLYWHLPVIAWGVMILILTSIPTLQPPHIGIKLEDKLYHFLVYFIFGFLLVRAFMRNVRDHLRRSSLLAALVGSAFGILDEWHQQFIAGRYCDGWDALADILGVLTAIVLFNLVSQRMVHFEEKWLSRPQ